MITNERFNELYIQVSTIFDRKVEQLPLLEIKDDCPKIDEETQVIFDKLGYFLWDTPDRVYLCRKEIEEFASKKNLDLQILTEIIAVHEIGHYIHCKLNTTYCTASDSETFNTFRKYFVESFAQLLTHKFCINNSEKYCSVFNTLKIRQLLMYRIYNEEKYSSGESLEIGGSLKQCPKSILENIFFDTILEEEEKKIGDSNPEQYFFELFEKPVLEYCEKEYTNKEILDGGDVETRKSMIEFGLADASLLNKIDSSFYFISKDSCSK